MFKRGINLSHWWAQRPEAEYTGEWLENRVTKAEIRALKEMGFVHVRLPVDFLSLRMTDRNDRPNPLRIMTLRRKVEELNAAGLFVILLSHNEVNIKKDFLTDETARKKLINFWTDVSYAMEGIPGDKLAFELVGEPNYPDGDQWWAFQQWLINHVHEIAPDRTIVANGNKYASLEDLLRRKPYGDKNVVYNASFYEPFAFTHQGAVAGWPESKFIYGLKYPVDADNIRSRPMYVKDKKALDRIQEYQAGKWNSREVRRRLIRLRDWAKTYKVTATINEFGVWKYQTPPGSREAWLKDVRVACENFKLGWTHWDYRGGFGICDSQDPMNTVDPKVLQALGMPKSRFTRPR